MSEAALFKSQLGASWEKVDRDIQIRFDADPFPGHPIFYDGVMTFVRCSWIGGVLARMGAVVTTGALCYHGGTNVPAEIMVFKCAGSDDICKVRRYDFGPGKKYVFESRMRLGPDGDLLEYVGRYLGMKVKVQEKNGALFFTDAGYFVAIAGRLIMLPRLLSPGDVELTHANLGPNKFKITIKIIHPLFGILYEQEGVFVRRDS